MKSEPADPLMGGTTQLVAFLASVLPPEVARGAAAAAAAHLKGQTGAKVENDDPRALVNQEKDSLFFFFFFLHMPNTGCCCACCCGRQS